MKCNHCGAPVRQGDSACPYCGAVFEFSQPMVVNIYKQEKQAEKPPERPPVKPPEIRERVVYVDRPVPAVSGKKRSVSLILCLLLGTFGAHKFYERRYGMGLLYLFSYGLFGIGILVDLVCLVFGRPTDKQGLPMTW